jgi:two-component system sensor histidine kinase HydH
MTQSASEDGRGAAFEEMKRYVGFDETDERMLRTLHAAASAGLESMLDDFYAVIQRHTDAARVFTEHSGDPHRLRRTLSEWTLDCLSGPWDEAYVARRRAIGQAHVRHRLPQRYMLLAMNVVRRWMQDLAFDVHGGDPVQLHACIEAVGRVLDMELALMLGTYRDDLVARMQRQERLATIGEVAASIHHELKNPLAAVDASLFAMGERRSLRADPRARELLDRARSNTDRASEIITDLLSFARLRDPAVRPTAVDTLIRSAVGRVSIPGSCRLSLDLDPALPAISVDGPQIEQVLVNLLQNAFDACDGGEVRIVTRLHEGKVRIAVIDDGVGIELGHLERVFEPLFSTKPEGVGLGLSLSRNLVHANRGSLHLVSAVGEGTTVSIVLPTV